jgi:hypothetical protein
MNEDRFDVVADVAGFRQGRSISDRKGKVENPRESLGQEGFSRSRWPDQQNVCLLELDIVDVIQAVPGIDPLVVIVHRDGKAPLGLFLADNVVIKGLFDLDRRQAGFWSAACSECG